MSLSYENTKKYLEIVLDLERNIYIQEQTLKQINSKYNALAVPQKFNMPQKGYIIFDHTLEGVLGTIAMIITFVVIIITGIPTLDVIIKGGIFGFLAAMVVFFTIYFIRYMVKRTSVNNDYNRELQKYNQTVANDKMRVNNENRQKELISIEYQKLYVKYKETKSRLQELYNYGILDEKYWGLVPVSSIYEYYRTGRTRSLSFDPSTGDTGAYNIFESEKRLDKIIANTEIIIKKLDTFIEVQRRTNATISKLVASTENLSQKVLKNNDQIQRLVDNSEISIYNQEQTNAELRYMNFMNKIYRR